MTSSMALESAGTALGNAGDLSVSGVLGLGGAFQKGLVFLLNLAWNSRFRLPVLITVGFMVLDVRMQLEINVDIEVRHVRVVDDEDDDDDDDDDGDDDEEDEFESIDNVDPVLSNSDSESDQQNKK